MKYCFRHCSRRRPVTTSCEKSTLRRLSTCSPFMYGSFGVHASDFAANSPHVPKRLRMSLVHWPSLWCLCCFAWPSLKRVFYFLVFGVETVFCIFPGSSLPATNNCFPPSCQRRRSRSRAGTRPPAGAATACYGEFFFKLKDFKMFAFPS